MAAPREEDSEQTDYGSASKPCTSRTCFDFSTFMKMQGKKIEVGIIQGMSDKNGVCLKHVEVVIQNKLMNNPIAEDSNFTTLSRINSFLHTLKFEA